jgi:hypothetical protein
MSLALAAFSSIFKFAGIAWIGVVGRSGVEKAAEARDCKDFVDQGPQLPNGKSPPSGKQFLAQRHQHGESHAGDTVHVAKIEDQCRAAWFVGHG